MKELIIKYLEGEVTEIELSQIRSWLESPKNKLLFEKYVKIHALINHMDVNVNTEEAYANILAEINVQPIKQSKKLVPTIPLWLKYTAAASIALMMLLVFNKETVLGNVSQNPTQVTESILPGSNKAVLVLEDGSTKVLEEGETFNTQNLQSDGSKLVYNSTTDNVEEEVIKYNRLRIPRGGQYQITLSDGTQVWLNSESEIKYPVNFKKGTARTVELIYGEAYFDVTSSEQNNGDHFKVLSQNQEIEVLGTEFNVKAYIDEPNTYTTLVEGKVELQAFFKSEMLAPNQQAVLSLTQQSLTVSNVDVSAETSWRKGVFSFTNKPLKEIMLVLSRWYDFEVVFENPKIEKEEFIGVLGKNERIEDILQNIKDLGIINDYKFDDKTIILK